METSACIQTTKELAAPPECKACGGRKSRLEIEKFGLTMRRCKSCGLLFTWPLPDQEFINSRYNQEWFEREYLPSYGVDPKRPSVVHLETRYRKLLSEIELLRRNNKVFDVGAGAGLFLWHARKAGWEVHGVELSSYGPAYAKRHFDLSIQQGTLSDVTFAAGSFDVVVMQDVLEHVSDVGETFRIANRLLRSGGAVVVQTPNYSGISRRVLGSNWSAISPAEHLSLLDYRSFRALCKATGFTAERFKRIGHVDWLPHVHDNTRRFTVIRQKVLKRLIRHIHNRNIGRFIGHYLGDELHVVARKVANS